MLGFNWRWWLSTKFSRLAGRARRKAVRHSIEGLEDRTLLSFTPPVVTDYPAIQNYLLHEATGDFNGDGKADIAVMNYLGIFDPLYLNVLQGNGDGTFQAQARITLNQLTDNNAYTMDTGRINGDSFDDLVLLNGSYEMKIFYGSATGLTAANSSATALTVQPVPGMSVPGGYVALGHFERTDRLDVAILPYSGNGMRLMVNQGDGTFVEQYVPLKFGSSSNVTLNVFNQTFDEGNQLLVEDLDKDGRDDAIFAFGRVGSFPDDQSGVLTIKQTGGADKFAVTAVAAGSLGQDLRGGDINGDGLLDLAITQEDGTGGVTLLRGQADGSFQAFASSPLIFGNPELAISSVTFGNFTGGPALDLVFNPVDGIPDDLRGGQKFAFGIAAGAGDGTFAAPVFTDRHPNGSNESPITEAGQLFAIDVDGEGNPDLVNLYRNFNFPDMARTSVLVNTGGTHTTLAFPDIEEGSPVVIEATVAKNVEIAPGLPTGTVTFKEGETVLGQATITNGLAVSDLLFLSAGQHTITAVYSGDSEFLGSAAPAQVINVIVNPGRTKTVLSFPNLTEDQALIQVDVTKYFQETPGIPAGTVTFMEGATVIGTADVVSGQAVAPLDLAAGEHTLFAIYGGNSPFTASTSKSITITIQPAPLPDLGLVRVETEGEGLRFNRENRRFEANGVIHIGLSVEPFQTLLDLSGSISVGAGTIVGNGTVTAHIGNYSAVLFDGEFQFNIGDAHTNEFELPSLPGSLTVAGMGLTFRQLELVNGGINVGGRLQLPNLFGDKFLSFEVGAGLHISASGVSSGFGGGQIGFPNVDFPLAGLGIKASDLSVDYDASQDRLKIQGKIGLPDLFGGLIVGATADLAGSNFIQVQAGQVDVVGDLTIKRLDIVPNTWTLKDVKLHVDTIENRFEGSGKLFFPGGFGVSVDLGLVAGRLDSIVVGVENLNIPIPFLPGAFLQSVGGGVSGLTTPTPTFEGDIGFSYLPNTSFDLPPLLGGQHFSISLVSLDVEAEVNAEHLAASGSIEVLKGVSGTGQNSGTPASVSIDWVRKILSVGTEMHLINNIVNMTVDLTASGKGNVNFQADATISLPDIDTGVLGIHIRPTTLAQARAELQFIKDANPGNDFVSLYGRVNLPIIGNRQIGVKLYFNGNVDFIGLKDPIGQTFNIPAGSEVYMLTATWENDVGDVPIEVIDPNGTVYTEADFDNTTIGLIDVLSGPKSKSIGLANPIPGDWTLRIPNEVGLGQVAMHGFFEVDPPTLEITSLTGGAGDITVGYDATSTESTATVAFYFDTDNAGFNGELIAGDLTANGSGLTYNWDPTGVPAGTYYVYGRIDDGINPAVFVYSPVSVTVANQAPVVSVISNQTVNEGATLTLTATAVDPNGDTVTFSLGAGAPAGVDIDPATGELTWTPTEAQGAATYQITVIGKDTGTPVLSGMQTFQVTVGEVNVAPVLHKIFAQSTPIGGSFHFTVGADDPDLVGQTLTFSLDAGAPTGAAIDPVTGEFSWIPEASQLPGVYPITFRVTDNGTPALSSTATIDLTIRDATAPGSLEFDMESFSVNEGGNATITVRRIRGSKGTIAVQYAAAGTSATAGQDFTATAGFLIFADGETSKTFVVPTLRDATLEGTEDVNLSLSGPVGGGSLGSQTAAVLSINNVVLVAPVFTSPDTFNVAENQTAVGTVTATDADLPPQTVTFSITGGADAAKFDITSNGVLTFKSGPDFDLPGDVGANNSYELQVTANDGNDGITVQNIVVTVTGVNDNVPVFTSSATFDVEENTTSVGTVAATDADQPAQGVTYSLTGGADQGLFTLTAQGALSFASAPDRDDPSDSNGDNAYQVQVTANDGNGGTTVQNIVVTVTGVNDNAPVFTSSATFDRTENSTSVGNVVATDADLPAQSLTYSLTGGVDQGLFTITANGALSFLSAPDFETPADSNADNVYEVEITANNGQGSSTVQNVTVTVTNLNDGAPQLTLGGSAVTFINKQPPVTIVPQLTVGGVANLTGGTLLLRINAVGTAKKLFDVLQIPSFTALGTSSGPQFAAGFLTLQIQLGANATNASIQSFLRGITFSTKGKGLKTLTRTVTATLTEAGGLSSSVSQTINVLKKAPLV